MPVTDPIDARLLAALADSGKAAVHELAAKVGMDPREVAYRLVALSGSGLPLLVGVECDPKGIRAAVAGARQAPASPPSGAHPVQGVPSGPYPSQGPTAAHGGPSAPYPGYGTPSAAYPVHGTPSAPYPVYGTPSAAYRPPPGAPAGHVRPNRPAAPAAVPPDPVMSTWGPPQTSSWARGDQPSGGGTAP